ncbi:MAG: hypothetical protein R2708_27740 [Vicinamibacterales bacterium]
MTSICAIGEEWAVVARHAQSVDGRAALQLAHQIAVVGICGDDQRLAGAESGSRPTSAAIEVAGSVRNRPVTSANPPGVWQETQADRPDESEAEKMSRWMRASVGVRLGVGPVKSANLAPDAGEQHGHGAHQ